MNENLHNATSLAISRLEGVTLALIELASGSEFLIGDSKEARAINALLHVIQDGIAVVNECHRAEWEAGRPAKA